MSCSCCYEGNPTGYCICVMVFVVIAGSLAGFKWTRGLSTFSIHQLIFFACVRMFHHIADTGEMNSLDLPLSPFPPSLWYNTTNPLRHVGTVYVRNYCKFVYKYGPTLSINSKVTPIFIRKRGPLILGSSVRDLIRVNKPQCGERNAMFSLLIGFSRTFVRDIRGTQSLFN